MPPTTAQNQADINSVEIRHLRESVGRANALAENNRTDLSKHSADYVGLTGGVQGLADHIKEIRSELKYWKRMLIVTMGGVIVQLIGIIWVLTRSTGG